MAEGHSELSIPLDRVAGFGSESVAHVVGPGPALRLLGVRTLLPDQGLKPEGCGL